MTTAVRKLLRGIVVMLAASSAGAVVASAQPVVRAWTDSTSYQIGRWITLQTEVELPGQTLSAVPVRTDTLGRFEVLRIDSLGVREEDGTRWARWRFILTTFDTGSQVIPPLPFMLPVADAGETVAASTRPVPLSITTVPVDPQGDLKDIKPPLTVPRTLADWTVELILLLALVAGEGVYLWRRLRRKKASAEEIPLGRVLPPHEIALMALREIEDQRLWQHGYVKEYSSAVTDIVRRFLGARCSIPAIEVTSDELLRELAVVPEAEAVRAKVRSLLTTADLVKFAKYLPTPEEHVQELNWAYDIVRTMIPTPVRSEEVREEEVHAG